MKMCPPITVSGATAEPIGDPLSQQTLLKQLMFGGNTPNKQGLPDLSVGATAFPPVYPPN